MFMLIKLISIFILWRIFIVLNTSRDQYEKNMLSYRLNGFLYGRFRPAYL